MKEKIELNSEAVTLRKSLGEDSMSPIEIISIVQNILNLTLTFIPMSNRISGMCIKIDDEEKLIAVNSTLSYGRQRFTIAHELYHLFFQSNFKSVICGKDIESESDDEERNADSFASFFLAPYDGLLFFIKEKLEILNRDFTIYDIVRIEQFFGMSRQATLYRLISEKFITPDYATNFKQNVINSARQFGYDDKLYIPTSKDKQYFTIGNYINLAECLKTSAKISKGKFEEYLLEAYRSDIVFPTSTPGDQNYD